VLLGAVPVIRHVSSAGSAHGSSGLHGPRTSGQLRATSSVRLMGDDEQRRRGGGARDVIARDVSVVVNGHRPPPEVLMGGAKDTGQGSSVLHPAFARINYAAAGER